MLKWGCDKTLPILPLNSPLRTQSAFKTLSLILPPSVGGHANELVNVCFEDGTCKVLGSEHYYYTTAYIIITLPALAMSIRAGDGYTGVSPSVLLPQPPAPESRFSYPGTHALSCLTA